MGRGFVRRLVPFGLAVPLVADAAGALVALHAWWRVRRLNAVARERSVDRLGFLFLFLGLATLLRAVDGFVLSRFDVLGPRTGDFGVLDALFWLRHAVTVVAIGAGALALHGGRRVKATEERMPVMGPLLIGAAPVLLFLEGMGFAYLAFRAGLNHLRRANMGSLQVTLGFFLLTAAWLVPLILFEEGVVPLGAPHWSSAVLALGGTVALALAVPRRRATRG